MSYLGRRITGCGDQHRGWGGREGEEEDAHVLTWVSSGSGSVTGDGESGRRRKFRQETNEFNVGVS